MDSSSQAAVSQFCAAEIKKRSISKNFASKMKPITERINYLKTQLHALMEQEHLTCVPTKFNNKKGKQLFIEGRIQTRKWQDREGKDRYNTEIVADNVRFLGGRGDSASYGGDAGSRNTGPYSNAPAAAAPTQQPPAPANGGGDMPYAGDDEDNIPF